MVGVIGIIAVQILKSSVQGPAKDVEQAAQSGAAAVHLRLAGSDLDYTQVVSLHSSCVMLQFHTRDKEH